MLPREVNSSRNQGMRMKRAPLPGSSAPVSAGCSFDSWCREVRQEQAVRHPGKQKYHACERFKQVKLLLNTSENGYSHLLQHSAFDSLTSTRHLSEVAAMTALVGR